MLGSSQKLQSSIRLAKLPNSRPEKPSIRDPKPAYTLNPTTKPQATQQRKISYTLNPLNALNPQNPRNPKTLNP